MSRTPPPLPPPAAATVPAEPRQDDHVTACRPLRAGAVAACVPCLAPKTAWPAGSPTGTPGDSTAPEQARRRAATPSASITYAVQVIIGWLIPAGGAPSFHRRSTP
ncbi:hypothetical protein AB0K89_24605 [Streptomyces cinnamoneus]|uniref:hypothetical protein n=1 Tax=Streptomyces cinnamoneus TaxID=53446 RepID=UPI00342130DD